MSCPTKTTTLTTTGGTVSEFCYIDSRIIELLDEDDALLIDEDSVQLADNY